ncbi:MAG: MFS transporter [Butyricicoccus sp.]|nr:MFS transporter [Butyricicoccus sp.]
MDKKRSLLSLEVLCCLVYFTSYITRVNYGAVMSELIIDLELTKSLASMAVTGSFVTYGLGQLLCGWCGDRIEPRRMISFGLFCTALCNFIMPLLADPYAMAVLWSCNGFFQSMLWPPLVRIMADHMSAQEYARATVTVSAMASVGTISVYLLTPVCISAASWHLVFLFPAVFGCVTALLWTRSTRALNCSAREKEDHTYDGGLHRAVFASALPVISLAIILQGFIRDGITTWMPVYLSEAFRMPNEFSILTSSILPLFSILGIFFAARLETRVHNELRSSFLLFAAAAACGLVILPLWNKSFVVVLVCFSILYSAICGINLLLISRVPPYFLRYGRVSVISGVLNAFTYIGSSLSSFGVGRMADRFNWQFVLGVWACAAAAGLCLCLCSIGRWRAFAHPRSKK